MIRIQGNIRTRLKVRWRVIIILIRVVVCGVIGVVGGVGGGIEMN